MTFPLEVVPTAVTARTEAWARLEMRWHTHPIQPNHGKPVVSVEFESSAWLAEIMIWVTGEAEMATIRRTDGMTVNKHYELADRDELEVLLDELLDLVVDDRIPGAAIVAPVARNDEMTVPANARTLRLERAPQARYSADSDVRPTIR